MELLPVPEGDGRWRGGCKVGMVEGIESEKDKALERCKTVKVLLKMPGVIRTNHKASVGESGMKDLCPRQL